MSARRELRAGPVQRSGACAARLPSEGRHADTLVGGRARHNAGAGRPRVRERTAMRTGEAEATRRPLCRCGSARCSAAVRYGTRRYWQVAVDAWRERW